MDAIFVVPLLVAYFVIRYYLTDHETPYDKDKKRYAEGITLFEKGDFEKAFDYFNQKLKENRKSALAYTYRGRCHAKADNLYSALYDFTEALSYDNTLHEVHLEKGIIHFHLEEYQEALKAFEKAVWFSRKSNAEAVRWQAIAAQKCHSA
ncbi:MAG: tetratricopeptide repeat protein [Runella sp.]